MTYGQFKESLAGETPVAGLPTHWPLSGGMQRETGCGLTLLSTRWKIEMAWRYMPTCIGKKALPRNAALLVSAGRECIPPTDTLEAEWTTLVEALLPTVSGL